MSAPNTSAAPAAPEIAVLPDADALAKQAADRFIAAAQRAVSARGRFAVALAGGSTPEKLYALLSAPSMRTRLSWDKLFFFMGDERFVPYDDPVSNYGMACRLLLDPVGVPASNRFPMPTPPSASDLGDAARRYTDTLSTFFQTMRLDAPPTFDLILLGMGEDGHTASLFPGKPSLETQDAWVVGTPPGTLPPPVDRLTLTYPVLNAAQQVLFLVSGAKKADPLHAVLEANAPASIHPAAGVHPVSGTLTYLLDEPAASKLSSAARP